MKVLLVIVDGLGDRPSPQLHGQTPLEAAHTPNLNALARQGIQGRVLPIRKGLAPESDVAVLALFGEDVWKKHTGRGPLEAGGLNLVVQNGELALRGNFATVKGSTIIDRRAGRTLTSREAKQLAIEIQKKVKLNTPFTFQASVEHRCVLVIRGKKLSADIGNTDPYYERVKGLGAAVRNPSDRLKACKPLNFNGVESAELVNEWTRQARKVLEKSKVNQRRKAKGLLPANAILLRDAGNKRPDLTPLPGWAAMAGMPLEKGIARAKRMKLYTFEYPEYTGKGTVEGNQFDKLGAEIMAAKKFLPKKWRACKGAYIHFKPLDVMGHNGNAEMKKEMVERLDHEFFSFVRTFINLKTDRMVVTADHATPCTLKRHSDDSVPLLVVGAGVQPDGQKRFREKNSGKLGLLKGQEMLKRVQGKELK